MQYSVRGKDGNVYGPVDLMTLKKWVQEGRIMPDSMVTDNLSSVTLMASQMPELGVVAPVNPYANTAAPPSNYNEYSRPGGPSQPIKRGTRLWGIIFWLVAGLTMSMFYQIGGVFISAWNIFDAFKAKSEDDPHAGWCLGVAIGGFLIILVWTIIKVNVAPR